MSNLSKLSHQLDDETGVCRVVIETPKGRRAKFDYDATDKCFVVKTLLPEGMSFPLDFGFVPSTLCDDGDPLDVMILADEANLPGVLLDVRLIGVIEAEEVEHERPEPTAPLTAAAAVSRLYADLTSASDLDNAFVDDLVQFWINKDRLEGKVFRSLGVKGPEEAVALVKRAARAADKGADR